MEAVSCPILQSLRLSGGSAARPTTGAKPFSTENLYYHIHSKNLSSFTSRNTSCYYGFGGKTRKRLHLHRFLRSNCSSESTTTGYSSTAPKMAVLLEVEGVLMDVYRLGNRQAFNLAFRKLGLDCANWSEPVYLDLVRKSAGEEERMLILFFNRIGWPTSVATSEKGSFMKNVLREKKNALEELVMSRALSLRPGAEEFIDDACKEDVPVVILTSYSSSGEKVARSIVEKLGTERNSKIKIVGDEEVKQSFYGQLVFGEAVSSSLDEQIAKVVSKAASAERLRVAEEVASMLKLKVELNNSSSDCLNNIVAALRAGAEYAEVPTYNCVLVAGSQSGVSAAERIGMPCVVLRSSSTSRAEFPRAIGVLDGFGGADLTVSKLRRKLYPS